MQPPAHRTPTAAQLESKRRYKEDYSLFFENLALVLRHEQQILQCDEYFFCRPEFASYGVYFSRPIPLGVLLLGWRHGILRELCCAKKGSIDQQYVDGPALVHFFGGMGSGVWWRAYCAVCKKSIRRDSNELVWERMAFAQSAYHQFRDWTESLEFEHYPSQKFSFDTPAIVPTTGGRMVRTKVQLIRAVTVAQLIEELKSGHVRPPTPRSKSLIPAELIVSREDGEVERFSVL